MCVQLTSSGQYQSTAGSSQGLWSGEGELLGTRLFRSGVMWGVGHVDGASRSGGHVHHSMQMSNL